MNPDRVEKIELEPTTMAQNACGKSKKAGW